MTDVKSVTRYWRDSVADEDLMAVRASNAGQDLPLENFRSGQVPASVVGDIQNASRRRSDRTRSGGKDGNTVIPVILLGRHMAPKLSHGAVTGRQVRPGALLLLPALMDSAGHLGPAEQPAWIPRQNLFPAHETGDGVPVIGDLDAQDRYRMQNRFGEVKDWEALRQWTEGLWAAVVNPEWLREISVSDRWRIQVYDETQGAGAAIIETYEALLTSKTPPLYRRLVHGRSGKATGISGRDVLDAMPTGAGTMTRAHGLAASQAEGLAALQQMKDGDILAVNGPPGTGKTTLLQTLIATRVVHHALARLPAPIIVGTSTNNQAVRNIIASMNEAATGLEANARSPSGQIFCRWVPDVPSYGLYLPSAARAEDARKDGFLVAQRDIKGNYSGLPEEIETEDYLDRAESLWMTRFRETCAADAATSRQKPPVAETLADAIESVHGRLKRMERRLGQCHEALCHWQSGHARLLALGELGQDAPRATAALASATLKKLRQAVERAETRLKVAKGDVGTALDPVTRLNAEVTGARRRNDERARAAVAVRAQVSAVQARLRQSIMAHGVTERILWCLGLFGRQRHQERFDRLAITAAEVSADEIAPPGQGLDQVAVKVQDRIRRLSGANRATATEWLASIEAAGTECEGLLEEAMVDDELALLEADLLAAHRTLAEANGRVSEAEEGVERSRKAVSEALALEAEVLQSRRKFAATAGMEAPESPDTHEATATVNKGIHCLMFALAMRYYEGCWIGEARSQMGVKRTGQGRKAVLGRFRRYAMLTPCLIVTLHSLGRHFRYLPPPPIVNGKPDWSGHKANMFLDVIDLLIVDEAGQVAPHIGASAFAFGKRAVVVGDVHQIQPVVQISRGADIGNSQRAGIAGLWSSDGEPEAPHLLSPPGDGRPPGSLMLLAQAATSATAANTSEPGIFLAEHRRCRTPIIAFCNDLVYRGRLLPCRPEPTRKPPLPPFAFAHVQGPCTRSAGSNRNENEARCIASWIGERADGLTAFYERPLNEVVAVVTPFRAQAQEIQKHLRPVPGGRAITVGTVHSLQGAERPVVIFSPTYDATTTGLKFFDAGPNMLNVAVSRAKDSFVVIGDMRLFRQQGAAPSDLLGRYLFSDPNWELEDAGGLSLPMAAFHDAQAERITSLQRHREVLCSAIDQARPGEEVVIVSPWLTWRAIEVDGIVERTRQASDRGAVVRIHIDGDLAFREPDHRASDATLALERAGATVVKCKRIHNKTIIIGDREIIEGSFNWLSAQRGAGDAYRRDEVSWRLTGGVAVSAISKARALNSVTR